MGTKILTRKKCIATSRWPPAAALKTMAEVTRKMIDLAAVRQNPSNFYLGFQETEAAPPTARIEETYGHDAIFQNIAARNALRHESYLALRQGKNGWEIIDAGDLKTVGVCVPPPEIWVNAAPFAQTVKRNFKGLLGMLSRRHSRASDTFSLRSRSHTYAVSLRAA